jgi:hypothetical protein
MILVVAIALSLAALAQSPQPTAQPSPVPRPVQELPKAPELVPPVFLRIEPADQNFHFAVFGDLRTAPVSDTASTNPAVRKAIIDAITREQPVFVAVSGDLVLTGDNSDDWAQWDEETAQWTKANIPIFPAIGNHELHGDQKKGLANYFRRFPELKGNRYYSARVGNLLVLTLDTSQLELSGPQSVWMKALLDDLAPEIDFVLIQLHHPPYTKSQPGLLGLGGHAARPAEIALGEWLEQKQKALRARLLVVAGHVHNYERYEHNGVTYIVSGGGGASPYSIPRSPTDAYHDGGPTYHYCTVDVQGAKLTLQMHKLEIVKGTNLWRVADKVEIKAAPRPVPPAGHPRAPDGN